MFISIYISIYLYIHTYIHTYTNIYIELAPPSLVVEVDACSLRVKRG